MTLPKSKAGKAPRGWKQTTASEASSGKKSKRAKPNPLEIAHELWLCDDCTIAEVNGDYSGMSDEREAEVKRGFDTVYARYGGHLSSNWDSETGEGVTEFSRRQCDVCGTRLAGGRHRFAVLKEVSGPPQPTDRQLKLPGAHERFGADEAKVRRVCADCGHHQSVHRYEEGVRGGPGPCRVCKCPRYRAPSPYERIKRRPVGHEARKHRLSPAARRGSLDAFTESYIETALWSSTDNSDDSGGDPLDANYDISDIDEATLDKMVADAADFQEKYGSLIDGEKLNGRYGNREQAGHDFWLTRNGHGAGFWDGDWPEYGDALTKASKTYGEFDLYVGDDGSIYGT